MFPHFSGSDASAYVGQRRERFPAPPAAGADWSFTLPAGAAYQLLVGTATLTTSAQVANRFPTIAFQNGDGLTFLRTVDIAGIAATTTASISFGQDVTTGTGNSGQLATIETPALVIDAGWRIAAITVGLQTEDAWSSIRLYLAELDDFAPAQAPGHEHRHHERIELELVGRAP